MGTFRIAALAAAVLGGAAVALGAMRPDGTSVRPSADERHRAVQSVTATHYGMPWPARPLGTAGSPVIGTRFP